MTQTQLLAAAEEKQRRAADPAVSAWVRANAGTGKTHVLVQRILRLLLLGAKPRSILCLTFTKNAAAEMEARVLSKLSEWTAASDAKLEEALAKTLSRAPAPGEIALARCLFATVIDAPGGLAIMTIHSFCERVLRRYSLEANVPPGFTVLTEEEAREALKEACASAFASATEGPLRSALECAAAYAREDEFARVLDAMLGKRSQIAELFVVTAEEHPLPAIEARLRRLFNLAPRDSSLQAYRKPNYRVRLQALRDQLRFCTDGRRHLALVLVAHLAMNIGPQELFHDQGYRIEPQLGSPGIDRVGQGLIGANELVRVVGCADVRARGMVAVGRDCRGGGGAENLGIIKLLVAGVSPGHKNAADRILRAPQESALSRLVVAAGP